MTPEDSSYHLTRLKTDRFVTENICFAASRYQHTFTFFKDTIYIVTEDYSTIYSYSTQRCLT